MNREIRELLNSDNIDDRILAVNILYRKYGDDVVKILKGDSELLDTLSVCIEFRNVRVWLHGDNTTHAYTHDEIPYKFDDVKRHCKSINFRIVDNRDYE